MKLIVKYFFYADVLHLGVILYLDKYIFLLQTCFTWRVILLYSPLGFR